MSSKPGPSNKAASSKHTPNHSRTPSNRSQESHNYAPIHPSGLREAHTLSQSPEDRLKLSRSESEAAVNTSNASQVMQSNEGTWSAILEANIITRSPDRDDEDEGLLAQAGKGIQRAATETSALLRKPVELVSEYVHEGECNHGTFSPRPLSRTGSTMSYISSGKWAAGARGVFGGVVDGTQGGGGTGNKRLSSNARFAQEHGIRTSKKMYLTYYVPFFAWIGQYRWSFLQGDLVAAVTMASFYIPMALSYASNLGHIPAINGLYSFVFNPIIYAVLGSCPQMVVGPEAAGSLLLGSVVRDSIGKHKTGDDNGEQNAKVAGVVTGMAGAVIFIAGLTRLGFIDSVLSRPFMRGFISSVGVIIIIDQLLTEMGLAKVAENVGGISHGSSIDKLAFLFNHWRQTHGLTCAVAFVSFAVTMIARDLKKRLQPRYPTVAYIPDRFLVVLLSAILTYVYRWDQRGLEVLGEVKSTSGSFIPFRWPFQIEHMKHVREAMSTSFLIALLGFFESSIAAKSLGGGEKEDGIRGIALSANRELVALGVANVVGGCFMALPAFGGYGRSKVNASTGGKTPMSSIFLSVITLLCIIFLLPYFYWLPVRLRRLSKTSVILIYHRKQYCLL